MTRHGQRRLFPLLSLSAAAILAAAFPVGAQDLGLNLGQAGLSERALQLVALITVLSLAPSILVMVTSFTRIVVALSLLRSAIGAQTAPPNTVITALALFLTAFVMSGTFQEAYDSGIRPLVAGQIKEAEAFERASRPFHAFMLKHARPKDVELFVNMQKGPKPETAEAIPLTTLIPAFMISELRRAFEIGFLIFLPFLIIDLIVSSILISMGMMMVPPVMVALPFKLVFFVVVDGWRLIVGALVQSFGG